MNWEAWFLQDEDNTNIMITILDMKIEGTLSASYFIFFLESYIKTPILRKRVSWAIGQNIFMLKHVYVWYTHFTNG